MKPRLIRTKCIISTIVLALTLTASATHAQQAPVTTEIIQSEGAGATARFRLTNGCLITRLTVSARVSFKDDGGMFGPGVALEFSTFDNCRFIFLTSASGFAPTNSALSVDTSYQSAHVVGEIELADSITKSLVSAHVDVWLVRSRNPEAYAENTVEFPDGTRVIEQFKGKIFPAVATGTLTLAGVEYPLLQSSNASIEAVSSRTITIEP